MSPGRPHAHKRATIITPCSEKEFLPCRALKVRFEVVDIRVGPFGVVVRVDLTGGGIVRTPQ